MSTWRSDLYSRSSSPLGHDGEPELETTSSPIVCATNYPRKPAKACLNFLYARHPPSTLSLSHSSAFSIDLTHQPQPPPYPTSQAPPPNPSPPHPPLCSHGASPAPPQPAPGSSDTAPPPHLPLCPLLSEVHTPEALARCVCGERGRGDKVGVVCRVVFVVLRLWRMQWGTGEVGKCLWKGW